MLCSDGEFAIYLTRLWSPERPYAYYSLFCISLILLNICS